MNHLRNELILRWLGTLGFMFIIADFLGCATIKIEQGIFSPRDKNFIMKLPESEKGWKPLPADKEDIALWHKQYKAIIAVISSDIENKGFSLEMLNRLLFLGITNKKIVSKESVPVDKQRALHMILEGELDHCRLKIDSYIIRIGDKVYDLVYWAPTDSFDKVKGDFEDMIRSFRFTP